MAQDRSDDPRYRGTSDEDHRGAGRDAQGRGAHRGNRRFRDERQRPESLGSDGYWDEAGHVDRPRQPYPPMTVPGAAAGYYAPYMYGSHGGSREPGPGGQHVPRHPEGDPTRGYGRNFMDRAADEVAAWFGDDAAQDRRDEDHRGRGPRNYVRSDARIEEDVNERLTEDYMIDARDVTVTVSGREVTLDGRVSSRAAKRRAEDIADEVSGVLHVQNNLRVRGPEDDL